MAKTRLDLYQELCDILGSDHVYYQPPESMKLQYDCFVYSRQPGETWHADNHFYLYKTNYQLMYITRDVESDVPEQVLRHFQMCRYDRTYVSDNLYHHVFSLFY